jgi:hypothetical protein
MAGRIMTAATIVLALLALAACGDTGSHRVRNYRPLPQNLPSNAAVESPNSMPP